MLIRINMKLLQLKNISITKIILSSTNHSWSTLRDKAGINPMFWGPGCRDILGSKGENEPHEDLQTRGSKGRMRWGEMFLSPADKHLNFILPNSRCWWATIWVYLEEGHAGASVNCAILYGSLVSQVIHWLNGHIHTLHGQEGCQVGRVGWDDDQRECPPMQEKTRKSSLPGRTQES